MLPIVLANGMQLEVSQEEVREFITQLLIPNPDWHHSGLLTTEEVERYLKDEVSPEDLKRVARYILIYEENLAFSGYLFDKADGEPERTKEFNMPALKKLRDLYQKVITSSQTDKELANDVHQMENICLQTGADPL